MQEIRSSNPPVVTGIFDPNKSRARHHRNLKFTIDTFENSVPNILDMEFVQMDLVFIINITKLVNLYTLTPMHYVDGELLGFIH